MKMLTYGITIAEGYIEVRQAFEGKSKTAQPKAFRQRSEKDAGR